MEVHASWLAVLAKVSQKSFKVMDTAEADEVVKEVDLSVLQNPATPGAADKTGWVMDIRWKTAPDQAIFSQTYVSEKEARQVMDDFSRLAAEIEGLIKQEKFDEARKASEAMFNKTKANSGESPVEEIATT